MAWAFIGSRDLSLIPPQRQLLFTDLSQEAVLQGHTVYTGAAPGADQLAATAALEDDGFVRLFLPWKNYEASWVQKVIGRYGASHIEVTVYTPRQYPEWGESVHVYHPAPDKLSHGAWALHARNYGLLVEAMGVVALHDGSGGTAQGLRIAKGEGMRIIDLADTATLARLREATTGNLFTSLFPKG